MSTNSNKPLAEVIESSLQHWLAQSCQWDSFPSFGSLVTIQRQSTILFGIVHDIKTGSMDPSRYPFPYQKTEEQLLKEQPQIFEFLKTTFSCLPLGYKQQESFYYQLPPEPPKIHSFVTPAQKELYQAFFCNEHYLHILFNFSGSINNLDELLLALLKQLNNHHILDTKKFERFLEMFSLLAGNDYRRLKLFLQRAQQTIKTL